MNELLALFVLLVSVFVYQVSGVLFVRYWLSAYVERRLEPLVRELPQVEKKVETGLEERDTRGRAKDI